MTAARRDLAPLLVFLAVAAFAFLGAARRDLWTTGEHRYAEVARVLLAPGRDHVVPHLNGAIYPDKPPLFFWAAGAAHALLGVDLPLSAKLPSVFGGAFTAMLTFLLARRWWGSGPALVAAGVLSTTELTDWASHSAQMDTFLTALITSALYCFVRADETPRNETGRRRLWTFFGFLAVGAGILAKGPPAVLIPGATILAFLLWHSPREAATPKLAWGAVVALLPAAVWAAAVVVDLGVDGATAHLWGNLIRGQAIGHAQGEIDKLQPWHFYLWNFPTHLLPWTLLLPAALAAAFRGRPDERRIDRFLLAWLFASWLLFSLSKAKRDLYLLPLHPAAALLIARLVRDAVDDPARWASRLVRWPCRTMGVVGFAAGCLAATAALAFLAGAHRALIPHATGRLAERAATWELLRERFTTTSLLFVVALSLVVAAGGWIALRAASPLRAFAGMVMAVAAFQAVDAWCLAPVRDPDESPRAFLEDVRRRVEDDSLSRLGGDGDLQYAVNWVLRRDRVRESFWAIEDGKLNAKETVRRSAEYLAGSTPRFLVTDAKQVRKVGCEIPGAVELLRLSRPRGVDLMLLGNAAAAARSR